MEKVLPCIRALQSRSSLSPVDIPAGGTLYKNGSDLSYQSLGLTLPVVASHARWPSIGVYIVNTDEEYQNALEHSFHYEDEVVVEPYIKGREFACGIIDGEALPPIEIIPKTGFFDYANKYQDVKHRRKSARPTFRKKLQSG